MNEKGSLSFPGAVFLEFSIAADSSLELTGKSLSD